MTTKTHRPTEAICPPWCSGHNTTGWQSWEDASTPDEARMMRTHASSSGEVAGHVGVELYVEEHFPSRAMSRPKVTLYTSNDDEDLTPEQARQVAAALLEAADRIEAAL